MDDERCILEMKLRNERRNLATDLMNSRDTMHLYLGLSSASLLET